jgi:hydrogenase expression/formation protein HypC
MCLAIPGQIIDFVPDQPYLARVDVAGVRRKVNIGLLEGEEIRPGDWVLIHVGFAMSKISEEAAREQLRMLEALGEGEQALEEVRGYRFAETGPDRSKDR